MAVRRAQASILSGVNSAANGITLDSGYYLVSSGQVPTATSSVTEYTSSITWTRPSNVYWIDIYLVGAGGSGGCWGGARSGGGGGGGAVVQFNQFYVGDYNTWYLIIGAGGDQCQAGWSGGAGCCCNSWGRPGAPTIFTPTASSFNFSTISSVDTSNLRRTLVAPGGAGGGHPCGGIGAWTVATSGGMGSNRETNSQWGVAREDPSGTRIVYSGIGGRGAAGSTNTGGGLGFGGGGGGAGGSANQVFGPNPPNPDNPSSNANGGAGKSLQSPFSGTYGGGGGGAGGSGGSGGGANGESAAGTGTGGGGGGARGSGQQVIGGSGRGGIRMYYSS
jgi:hypothetical protein